LLVPTGWERAGGGVRCRWAAGPQLSSSDPGRLATSRRSPLSERAFGAAAGHNHFPHRHWHPLRHFQLHHLLTLRCDAHDHGGNPPPRREGRRGHLPPSAALSSKGKERVTDPRLRRRDRAPVACSPRVPPPAREPSLLPLATRQPPAGDQRYQRYQIYCSLTFRCEAHDHRGNPPPRREGRRGHLPPSAALSSKGKERVTDLRLRRPDPTALACSPRLLSSPHELSLVPLAPRSAPAPDCPRRQFPLHQLLTFRRDAHDHGGNPPPRREGRRGHLPSSPALSSKGEEGVNGPARRPAPQVDAPSARWLAERVDGGDRGPGGQAAAAESLKVPVPAGAERW
jgi:hypothetical protein